MSTTPIHLILSVGAGIYCFVGITDMIHWLRKARAEAEYRSRTEVAETAFKKAVGVAEKRLGETRSALEQKIRDAETQRKKTSDALQWFQSQVSTIT